ncbi:GNAT family N-acetyltransferase [Chromobacterium haemolyticum]|nr:GNAT family N-acetyltransferase [Chromobacterium haemolyticum]
MLSRWPVSIKADGACAPSAFFTTSSRETRTRHASHRHRQTATAPAARQRRPFHAQAAERAGLHRQYRRQKRPRPARGALRYIEEGPQASYRKHGHGLLLVERLEDGVPVGICGLVKREGLAYPDIGYAFLEQFWGSGYASEAAQAAAIEHGREQLGHEVVVGITAPHNQASIRVLEKIGLRYQGRIELPGIDGDSCYFVPPGLLKPARDLAS